MNALQLVDKLVWVNGNVTIKDGILWLPDGTSIDLIAVSQNKD